MSPHEIARRFESVFTEIQYERMHDVPILNQNLKVEAVGFQGLDDQVIGVLVTPWFMNLLLIDEAACAASSGDTSSVSFPCGDVEFMHGEEARLGSYRLCSLFSPMFEFEDQEAAVATAAAVLDGMMKPAAQTLASEPEIRIEPESGAEPEIKPTAPPAPLSRRQLFRRLSGGGQV